MSELISNIKNDLLKRLICRLFLHAVFGLFIPLLLIWCSLVIHFTFNENIRLLFIILYSLGSLFLLLLHKRIDRAVQIFAGVSLLIALWFIFLPASNERQWAQDASRLPAITIDGDKITIKDFRHFKYIKDQIQ